MKGFIESPMEKGKFDMRYKTTAFLAALILCLGLFLSGCGNDPSEKGGQVRLDSNAKPSAEKTLTFFAPVDGKSTGAIAYRKRIDQYNAKQSGNHVIFEGISTADGFNRYLEERLAAGKGDDVFIVNEDSVKPFYAKHYFYNVSSLPAFQQLNEAARAQAIVGDIGYCLPVNMTAYALFVNLDALARHGLQPPENLDDFLAACRTIKARGETPLSLSRWHAIAVPTIANGLHRIYQSAQRQEIVEKLNAGEARIGDYMLEGFEVFQQCIQEGWYGDNLSAAKVNALRAGAQDIPDFAAGKTAFYFGPLEYIPWLEELNPKLNYQVQGVPIPGGAVTLPSVVSRLCVNARSRALDEALRFVSYLADGIYQEAAQTGEAWLPVYEGADFTLRNERMRPAYETYLSGGQVPAEDMQLHFTYWDTVRALCLKMVDGLSAQDAAAEFNRIQTEQLAAFKR